MFNNRCLLDCATSEGNIAVKSIVRGTCHDDENDDNATNENDENEADNDDNDDRDPGEKCIDQCTFDKEDVSICGSDGVMYANQCSFGLAVCRAKTQGSNLQMLGDGSCEDNNKTIVGQRDGHDNPGCGMVCTKILSPVCGSDGVTRSNKCMMDLAACEENKVITKQHDGACGDNPLHNGRFSYALQTIA